LMASLYNHNTTMVSIYAKKKKQKQNSAQACGTKTHMLCSTIKQVEPTRTPKVIYTLLKLQNSIC